MSPSKREDITIRLAIAALDPESVEVAEMEALLREAITAIEMLRVLASTPVEVELDDPDLDDVELVGNA